MYPDSSLPKREQEMAIRETIRSVVREVYPDGLVPERAVAMVDD